MIKNLLNADEEPPEGTKVIIEDSIVNAPANLPNDTTAMEEGSQKTTAFEIPENAQFFLKSAPSAEEAAEFEQFSAAFEDIEKSAPQINQTSEITNEIEPQEMRAGKINEAAPADHYDELLAHIEREEPEIFAAHEKTLDENFGESAAQSSDEPKLDYTPTGTLFQSDYTPPSTAQTIRNSGLAWSAGVVLFGSVIFMMIFGWFADLLLGSSPWGLVGGIILGGLIGIVQLFRISSQIYRK